MKYKTLWNALELMMVCLLAALFWTGLLFKLRGSYPSVGTVVAWSAFYGSAFLYVRLLEETGCKKCRSLLPFLREEVNRRHVRDEEQCKECERGGEAWGRHYLDLYVRVQRVEIVTIRCRRCHALWNETQRTPASGHRRVRTIDISE